MYLVNFIYPFIHSFIFIYIRFFNDTSCCFLIVVVLVFVSCFPEALNMHLNDLNVRLYIPSRPSCSSSSRLVKVVITSSQ